MNSPSDIDIFNSLSAEDIENLLKLDEIITQEKKVLRNTDKFYGPFFAEKIFSQGLADALTKAEKIRNRIKRQLQEVQKNYSIRKMWEPSLKNLNEGILNTIKKLEKRKPQNFWRALIEEFKFLPPAEKLWSGIKWGGGFFLPWVVMGGILGNLSKEVFPPKEEQLLKQSFLIKRGGQKEKKVAELLDKIWAKLVNKKELLEVLKRKTPKETIKTFLRREFPLERRKQLQEIISEIKTINKQLGALSQEASTKLPQEALNPNLVTRTEALIEDLYDPAKILTNSLAAKGMAITPPLLSGFLIGRYAGLPIFRNPFQTEERNVPTGNSVDNPILDYFKNLLFEGE